MYTHLNQRELQYVMWACHADYYFYLRRVTEKHSPNSSPQKDAFSPGSYLYNPPSHVYSEEQNTHFNMLNQKKQPLQMKSPWTKYARFMRSHWEGTRFTVAFFTKKKKKEKEGNGSMCIIHLKKIFFLMSTNPSFHSPQSIWLELCLFHCASSI